MSAPDEGMLTAQERAALASLEARAAADDPRLADHLRGLRSPKKRLRPVPKPGLSSVATAVARIWLSLHPAVWGPLLTLVGLALVLLGVAASLALSLTGVAVAATGLGLLARLVAARVEWLRQEQTRLRASSPPE
ncbi:hypothetical protein K6U06_21525 [Acidiferrimicrobium sp. IK]|uniref:hypothetical protein n=1 Tax=Acidiferrimicrobium sp. IK TaxID=2871700 RepID=UPI0021CB669E|nr:hypothetical protein [Acidiferrimicrobium sp. IK]MCU4186961.1 hypothetical protein [Acidiferrimicrobium sp. IK]